MRPHRLRACRLAVTAVGLLVAATALAGAPGQAAVTDPADAAVTQPPSPVDPSPIDGETYYLINQASGLQADLAGGSAVGAHVVAANRSFTNLSQRWAMTKVPGGTWKISNMRSGLCLDSLPAGRVTWTVQNPCGANIASQEWTFSYVTNGYNTIRNARTHLALDLLNSGVTAGTRLIQSQVTGTATQSQLWLFRPTYFLGNDSSLQEKSESDLVAANSASAPWWHDAYLPGQDLLQIFKDNGINMIRLRPASINTTVVHNGVSFPITTGPYNNYTLAPPPASQIIPASANPASPGGTSSGDHAETDWSAVDLASRAKKLGMSVNLTLFYSGDNTSETPGNWAGKTVDQLAGVPPKPGLMYDYVKQEMELFRANGAWPDLVSIGNEVNDGMFTTTGAGGLAPSGTNCTPTLTGGGTGTANCFPRIQQAAMQAIADAASDTSDPALLGPPLPPPLTCIHVDGNPDLQTFFAGATQTSGIPVDVACESYYPGWHGPLTQAQQTWHPCNAADCGSTVQHVAEADFATEASGLGLPIFTIEDGVAYSTSGSPLDPYYGVNPPGPSKTLQRQGLIDLNKVEENIPNHLALGMEWWAGEANPIPGSTDVRAFWGKPGRGLFDSSTTAGSRQDDASLPVMAAMGGKLDPTLSYKLVSAANGRILQPAASGLPGALDTGPDTGITRLQQQWQFSAQGADPEQNATTYPTPMDHRGDGYFQIMNSDHSNGVSVLDTNGSTIDGSPVVQNHQSTGVFATTGTNADQEWDILPAGNCGDIPADCSAPPLVTHGEGDYYVIVNKVTGKVLAASGTGTHAVIQQQAPAAPSNGDWIEPASKGQLWRIVAAHITAGSTAGAVCSLAREYLGRANGASGLCAKAAAIAASPNAAAKADQLTAFNNEVGALAGSRLSTDQVALLKQVAAEL
jgi:arabinogalactan endo-1,4-beta-galactosidase